MKLATLIFQGGSTEKVVIDDTQPDAFESICTSWYHALSCHEQHLLSFKRADGTRLVTVPEAIIMIDEKVETLE
jgi:hypothetical protein